MSGCPYRRFLAWTVPACVVWATLYISVASLAAGTYRELADQLHYAGYIFVAIIVVFLVLVFVSQEGHRARRAQASGPRRTGRAAGRSAADGRGRLRGCPRHTAAPTRAKVLWLARLEYRFHAWRERRARRRGQKPTVTPFPCYAGPDWVRVLGGGRMIVPPVKQTESGEFASVRGWRSFVAVPIGYAQVTVTIAGTDASSSADRGGVVDTRLPARLEPGWQTFTVSVEKAASRSRRARSSVGSDIRFGVVSDVDDTGHGDGALPRPLLAAWNSFVVDEHARQPVPGMAVLMERVVRDHPRVTADLPVDRRVEHRPHPDAVPQAARLPAGAHCCSPTGDRHTTAWFRSGKDHKLSNLRRLARGVPATSGGS